MSVQVVILAGGQGKRMHSSIPKVLHHLAGKPLLEHVIDTALAIVPETPPVIVYGHQGKLLLERFSQRNLRWVEQKEQLGTGHAMLQALPEISGNTQVLVLSGDVPLITPNTLKKLLDTTPADAIGMLTAQLANPFGYGRIIRDNQQRIVAIVEEKDATAEVRVVTEINTGVYYFPVNYLRRWLPVLDNRNAQSEYYLTEVISKAVSEHIPLHSVQPAVIEEILGVNDRQQLAHLERYYQRQMAEKLMRQGVTLYDPQRFDLRGEAHIGRDVSIDVNVIFEGRVVIGDECEIGPNVLLRNVELAKGVRINANSVVEDAKIGPRCIIGPFARIRPGTVLAEQVHIGNFVEIKKSVVAHGSKVNHLTYIGDSEIGRDVNVGAGTITCNYDGVNKHKTIIGDNAFIGSCTQLVAPVTIGEGATIGAGSTITRDAPPHKLTLSRAPQVTLDDWQRPQKRKNGSQSE